MKRLHSMPFKAVTRIEETEPTRRDYVLAGFITLLVMSVVGGLIYSRMWGAARRSGNAPRLEGALRAGVPEFESLRERITVENLVATMSTRAAGDVTVELTANVRNETGRSLRALEVRGAVMSGNGQVLGERTVVVISAERTKIPPGEELNVRVVLEGIDSQAEQADVRIEIVGVRLD